MCEAGFTPSSLDQLQLHYNDPFFDAEDLGNWIHQ